MISKFPFLLSSLALAVLWGCGAPESIPQAEYAQRMAEVTCDRMRECQRGTFDSRYYGAADCQEELRRTAQSTVDELDELGCNYDAQKAADVWVLIHDMSCEKFYEGEYYEEQQEALGVGDCF